MRTEIRIKKAATADFSALQTRMSKVGRKRRKIKKNRSSFLEIIFNEGYYFDKLISYFSGFTDLSYGSVTMVLMLVEMAMVMLVIQCSR
jgi:hypothetical protein